MRCPDCNKFTSQDSIDPEVTNEHVGEGLAQVEIRICRVCQECGTELKEHTFDFDIALPQEVLDHDCGEGEANDITVTTTCENTERKEGKGRYTKTFYGVEATFEFSCATCGSVFDGETKKDEIQASGMDDL